MMNKRPRISVPFTRSDYFLEIVGAIGAVCLILLPIYFYNDLPDKIPQHFNLQGQVDSYGSRSSIWELPIMGLVLFVGLTVLNKYPFIFNYPTKVTNENAAKLYVWGTKTIRWVKVLLMFLLLFIQIKTIGIAIEKAIGLG